MYMKPDKNSITLILRVVTNLQRSKNERRFFK